MRKIIALAQLSRVGMAPLTISVPILGACAVGHDIPWWDFIGLGMIGWCAHSFGFALNDLIDLPLDRNLPFSRLHPLITGRLKLWEAWTFILIQIPISMVIYYLLGGTIIGLGFIGLSISLSVVYNIFSKWRQFPRFFAELGLASSISLLCFAGAYLISNLVSVISVLYSIELGLVLLLLNSVSSGLKDLKTDYLYGAKSFVLSTGCQMADQDRFILSKRVKAYSWILQVTIWVCGLLLVKFLNLIWVNILFAAVLCFFSTLHLRMLLSLESFSILGRVQPLLNGYFNYTAVAFLLILHMPLVLQILYGILAISLFWIPIRTSVRLWHYRAQKI